MSEAALQDLAGKLYDAKRAEENAKLRRIQIEEQITELIETAPNGSKTVDAGNGVKVTVKRAIGYKADVEEIRRLDLPASVLPLKMVPASYEFDERRYEELRASRPDIIECLAPFVTTTPRKPSVTLKLA